MREAVIRKWLEKTRPEDSAELEKQVENEPNEIEDAFSKALSFGTGGLRGIMGIGPNRMNIYTVGQATQGLSDYLLSIYASPSVVLCRDSRSHGEDFVRIACEVLAANGIKTFVFPRVEPTPALSFAVRFLNCSAGINITASHNPASYNGYKVYGPDGCQITSSAANAIQIAIDKVDVFDDVKSVEFQDAQSSGLIDWVDDDVLAGYISGIVDFGESVSVIDGDLSLVYTPLNGVGAECVSKVLTKIDINDFLIVPEQAQPDGDFPTCPSPNPEIRDALELGLDYCKNTSKELLLATDPDADRLGVAIVDDEDYEVFNGNEVGILLLDWLCKALISSGKSLEDKVVVTTIVSTTLADALAKKYGFELRRTLTGFKYIGEQIGLLESCGELSRFIFGFEESCGYLAGTQVRDKDGVMACMLVCQMTRWYKNQGISLREALDSLYEEFGYYRTELISVDGDGVQSLRQLEDRVSHLRINPPEEVGELKVLNITDYRDGVRMPIVNSHYDVEVQMLEPSNVLEIMLENNCKVMIRPSGTEPKVKAYLFSFAESSCEASKILQRLSESVHQLLA